jgi:hypothetical protein
MFEKTVIIANRRRGSDYWEGYIERFEAEAKEWMDYYRGVGQIVKIFSSMNEFRADCEKLLDKWEAKRARDKDAF